MPPIVFGVQSKCCKKNVRKQIVGQTLWSAGREVTKCSGCGQRVFAQHVEPKATRPIEMRPAHEPSLHG